MESFLRGHGVAFDLIEHARTERATAEARAANLPAEQTAKTVVLRTPAGCRLAIVPASERLDLHKVCDVLELGRQDVRLASEAEMASDFPEYDVGAIPPIGPRTPAELFDRRLLEYSRVLCPAGDHQHSILLNPDEIVRVSGVRVVDVCEE